MMRRDLGLKRKPPRDCGLRRNPHRWPRIYPADFGLDVTIGIAAKTLDGTYIATVSDRMVSHGYEVPAAENAALKSLPLPTKTWRLLYAAIDICDVHPIWTRASELLKEARGKEDRATVQAAVSQAYVESVNTAIAFKYLKKFGIEDATGFRRNGLAQFGEKIFADMKAKIDEFDLGVQLIIYGFDSEKKTSHVIEITSMPPGQPANHDLTGYCVIGSGAYMAMASLNARPLHFPHRSPSTLVYWLCEAKFAAETAEGVGKFTTVLLMDKHGKEEWLPSKEVEALRKCWEDARMAPPTPAEGILAPWLKRFAGGDARGSSDPT